MSKRRLPIAGETRTPETLPSEQARVCRCALAGALDDDSAAHSFRVHLLAAVKDLDPSFDPAELALGLEHFPEAQLTILLTGGVHRAGWRPSARAVQADLELAEPRPEPALALAGWIVQ